MYRVITKLETPDKVYEPGDEITNYEFYTLDTFRRHHFEYFNPEEPVGTVQEKPKELRPVQIIEKSENSYGVWLILIISLLLNIFLLCKT